jgi:hypothetical protein
MNGIGTGSATMEPTVIYVCAAARSGSTLSDMFLGGHSRISSLGELSFRGKLPCFVQQESFRLGCE